MTLTVADDHGHAVTDTVPATTTDPVGPEEPEEPDEPEEPGEPEEAPPNQAPVAHALASCTELDCTFSAAGSTDPDNDPITYTWDLGDSTDPVAGVTADPHLRHRSHTDRDPHRRRRPRPRRHRHRPRLHHRPSSCGDPDHVRGRGGHQRQSQQSCRDGPHPASGPVTRCCCSSPPTPPHRRTPTPPVCRCSRAGTGTASVVRAFHKVCDCLRRRGAWVGTDASGYAKSDLTPPRPTATPSTTEPGRHVRLEGRTT